MSPSEKSCPMKVQGIERGACLTQVEDGSRRLACRVTLKQKKSDYSRRIESMHLSRPEDYFSIYQSGCNHSCLKCHSSSFSKSASGYWVTNTELANVIANYMEAITVWEPRERATMWHAGDLCKHCGMCVLYGERSPYCPRKLELEQIVPSVQGWGPSRNIAAFTGGDILCRPDYYVDAADKIRNAVSSDIWILLETNGFGLTDQNLEELAVGGIDAFWLDLKAYSDEIYRKLCGTGNKHILESLGKILDHKIVLETLVLYIPGWVEVDQHIELASLISEVDPEIPTTLLAFFPSYKLSQVRSPTLGEMMQSYIGMKNAGLKNIRFGNVGVFCKTREDQNLLFSLFGERALG